MIKHVRPKCKIEGEDVENGSVRFYVVEGPHRMIPLHCDWVVIRVTVTLNPNPNPCAVWNVIKHKYAYACAQRMHEYARGRNQKVLYGAQSYNG